MEIKNNQYRYKVVILDSCGRRSDTSNFAQTILLNANAISETLSNDIFWTNYLTWDGNIDRFELYRKSGLYYGSLPIAVLSNNQYDYNDDIFGQNRGFY